VGCLGLANLLLSRPGDGLSASEEERAFFNTIEVSAGAALQNVPGLGLANRAKLLAAFELGRRYALFRDTKRSQIKSTPSTPLSDRALKKILPALRGEAREWLGFVPYYRSTELGDLCVVERGVRTHVNIDPAELFARLLALRPLGYFLVHNHPSGNTTPSEQDFELTRRVGQLSKQLGIHQLGHWIVAPHEERLIGMEIP
jgi:DNA repair protein RadC